MRGAFKSYDVIAIHAGIKAGAVTKAEGRKALDNDDLRAQLVNRVAQDAAAAKLRGEMFVDFESRLRDTNGWSIDQLTKWFRQTYGPIGRASIARVRASARAHQTKILESAAEARAFVELAEKDGADDVIKAAGKRAGQLFFQILMEVKGDELGGEMNLKRLADLVKALAGLQTARAQSDLIGEKVAEMRRAVKKEVDKATSSTKGQKLTRQAVFKIIDSVMKGKPE